MTVNFAVQAGLALARSKTGRNVFMGAIIMTLLVPIGVVALPVSLIFIMGSASAHGLTVSGACVGDAPAVVPGQRVGSYGERQLKIAATIIAIGQSKGIDQHGQTIAVMVAMGESSLQNLNHGDAVDNTTIGVFQQGASYGTSDDRLNVAKAASAFYDRMVAVAGWETSDPSAVGHSVEMNQDPNHYASYYAAATAVVAALTGTGTRACDVPANAKAAAAVLVTAITSGKLTFLESAYKQQIIDMAKGTAAPSCALDVHVLQIMVIAVNNFDQVGVSDLNRRCTRQTPGAGTASQHWKGKAVDIYALNHRSLTGSDALSSQLIHLLDPYVPHGSGIGQSNCRDRAHDPLTGLQNFTLDFADTCNHQHIQVP